jgi:type IV pilus assembly protein PilA
MPSLRRGISNDDGFTLVELLVVVLCIGILSAIAIPSFLNQRSKAQDGAAKSDVRTAQTATETNYINEQTYATISPAQLKVVESSLNNANLTTASGTINTYTIAVTSKSNGVFTITRGATGIVTRTCTPVGKGACANNGSW